MLLAPGRLCLLASLSEPFTLCRSLSPGVVIFLSGHEHVCVSVFLGLFLNPSLGVFQSYLPAYLYFICFIQVKLLLLLIQAAQLQTGTKILLQMPMLRFQSILAKWYFSLKFFEWQRKLGIKCKFFSIFIIHEPFDNLSIV